MSKCTRDPTIRPKKVTLSSKDICYLTLDQMMVLRKTFNYLYKNAFIDLMTGLRNRNAFEKKIKTLNDNPQRLTGLRVVMLDINDMKNINDNYGHAAGDEAIRIVGKCIREAFDSKDFCARYGGDEFVCLSYFDVSQKIATLNRLLKTESYSLAYPLTVSIGVVAYSENQDDKIDSLIKRCDQLMYLRKKDKINKAS